MTTKYLVLFDADRIKDYVFATGRLKEIRGASEQVRQLTDRAAVKQMSTLEYLNPVTNKGIIYAGGGAGALLFAEEEHAAAFCRAIEHTYRRTTRAATLSAVYVPVQYGTTSDPHQSEYAAQTLAERLLARRKASRPQAEHIPGGGFLRFCSSDRLYPASSRIRRDPDTTASLLVSESTAIKHVQNKHYRDRQTFLNGDFWQAFEPLLPEVDRATWRKAVYGGQDLDAIGRQARPRGYVALVYADGDRIGKTKQAVVKAYGLAGYAAFSQALSEAANRATAQALADAYKWRAPRTLALPFEVITIGGDDILLICTAERGLQVACTISRMFGEQVQQVFRAKLQEQGKTIDEDSPNPVGEVSASVGVVLAHDSLPIVQLERRGRELLKSAKKQRGGGQGGIDFHIVKTPGMDDIHAVRSREYMGDEQTALTIRPYRSDKAETLLRYARHLNGLCDSTGKAKDDLPPEAKEKLPHLPNSKRSALYAACQGHRTQMMLDVLSLHARLGAHERRALLDALHALGCIQHYPFAPQDEDGIAHTALLDLLEVMEFVAEEGRWA
jgi:hypothetical protein